MESESATNYIRRLKMSRKRISAASKSAKNKKWIFKEIKSNVRGLFGASKSSLSQRDQDYLIVIKEIQNLSNGKDYQEISIKQLSHFFIVQYKFRFGIDCIDYNWFNFKNTMIKLKDYIECTSWIELALFIYYSFEKCLDRTFSKEEVITLSTFKRSWMVDELRGKKEKFSGFY